MDNKWGYLVIGLMGGLGLSACIAGVYGLHVGAVRTESVGVLSAFGTLGTVGAAVAAAYSAKLSKDAAQSTAALALEGERTSCLSQAHAVFLRAGKKSERAAALLSDLMWAGSCLPDEKRKQLNGEIEANSDNYKSIGLTAAKVSTEAQAANNILTLLSLRSTVAALESRIAVEDWIHEQERPRWLREGGPQIRIGSDNDVLSV